MAMTHIKDGELFFDPRHSAAHKAFGFHGSAEGGAKPPFAGDKPTSGPKHTAEPTEMGEGPPDDYAHGGMVHPHHHPHGHHVHHVHRHEDGTVVEHHHHGGMTMHHPDGHVTHHHHDGSPVHAAGGGGMHHMHPHGHHVTHVEHREHDGAVVHHHAHGGHTVHHPDGRITHHHADGSPVHMAHGGHEHDPEGEYVHRAHGGSANPDAGADKALVKKAFAQHDQHMHGGESEHLALARGGFAGHRQRLPHQMKAPGMRPHSPIETPPRNPNMTTTPTNDMPAGQMGYGVQPSAEPDMAGSEQGISQMHKGGRARHKA